MRPTALLLALLSCAAAGCAEAPPPPNAPHRVAWQAFCEQAWSVPHLSALVAQRGADGWELVAMYNGVACYKRPAGEAPAPRWPQVQMAPQPAYGTPTYGTPTPPTPRPASTVPMWDPGF